MTRTPTPCSAAPTARRFAWKGSGSSFFDFRLRLTARVFCPRGIFCSEGMQIENRATWTILSDAQLLAQCEVDTYRASGPGGQKRNKTSSAVRLRHIPSGLIVIAEESRSQHENRQRALRRLRQAIFLKVRDDLPVGELAARD